jgi:DNA-binding CsgD family transcriptional regulator
MSIFKRMLEALGLLAPPLTREFNLDEDVRASLLDLAEYEQRPVNELANELLQRALSEHHAAAAGLDAWQQLSPRQQQITALVCLGYTNQQIAARLKISPETVKSHLRAVLTRFGLHSKTELSRRLSNWDFSAWDRG